MHSLRIIALVRLMIGFRRKRTDFTLMGLRRTVPDWEEAAEKVRICHFKNAARSSGLRTSSKLTDGLGHQKVCSCLLASNGDHATETLSVGNASLSEDVSTSPGSAPQLPIWHNFRTSAGAAYPSPGRTNDFSHGPGA